jgi:hypothetical protein
MKKIKEILEQLRQFLKDLFSQKGLASSKRFVGIIVILTILIYAICVKDITVNVLSLHQWLITAATALLGVTIFEKKDDKKNE